MASSLAEQLRPALEEWGRQVAEEAADSIRATVEATAPNDTGEMVASIQLVQTGPLSWAVTVDDRGFTDVGPEAHTIEGNPLLAFDWPAAGRFPAILRSVYWTPGPGVAENRGWFSERACTDEQWGSALDVAAGAIDLS